ncbi:hypothetical protein MMC22_007096 [Lobaria immixta]|nr:hypothetical protein [Lobaria immixta]
MSSTGQTSPTYLPTIDAYNQWAEVRSLSSFPQLQSPQSNSQTKKTYDASPNFLPPLSTHLFLTLLAPALPTLPPRPLLIDLGCGTARTTTILLTHPEATVLGLDASPAMLDVARQRCEEHFRALPATLRAHGWDVGLWDLLAEDDVRDPASPQHALPHGTGIHDHHHRRLLHEADLVTSTLVLEHIPLHRFFRAAASLLRAGGLLVLTNMHADMGRVTQAGFRNADGVKIHGHSHAHQIPDVLDAAREAGFEQAPEDVLEIGVTEQDLSAGGPLGEGRVNEGARIAARKWHVTGKKVLFGGVWRFLGGGGLMREGV